MQSCLPEEGSCPFRGCSSSFTCKECIPCNHYLCCHTSRLSIEKLDYRHEAKTLHPGDKHKGGNAAQAVLSIPLYLDLNGTFTLHT